MDVPEVKWVEAGMILKCQRVRNKVDGWWLKVLGWGMGPITLEWTQEKGRSFLFLKDDWVLRKALGTLKAQGVQEGALELVEEDWDQEKAMLAEMGQPAD